MIDTISRVASRIKDRESIRIASSIAGEIRERVSEFAAWLLSSERVRLGPVDISRRALLLGAAGTATAAAVATPYALRGFDALEKRRLVRELLYDPKILSPTWTGQERDHNAALLKKWAVRYLGRDPSYNRDGRMGPGGPAVLRNRLVAGWKKLSEGDDLALVRRTCERYGVPFDVVFLALGESHWDVSARSFAEAQGPWQFVPDTARRYWLMDGDRDLRTDVAASTDAAVRMLRENYETTRRWDRALSPAAVSKITDHDRWAYAFWYYNRGNKVRADYERFEGRAAPYAAALGKAKVGSGRQESSQYVAKLFGIREAVRHLYETGEI